LAVHPEELAVIVTDPVQLRLECAAVRNVREGGEIARRLWAELERHNKRAQKKYRKSAGTVSLPVGVGIAAPQIGVQKRVCVIKVGTPLVLMNPVVVDASSATIPFVEGCLSFPGVQVSTRRHVWVKVQAMNHPDVLTFGPTTPEEWEGRAILLECIAVQHEVSHLDGKLMFDYAEDQMGVAA